MSMHINICLPSATKTLNPSGTKIIWMMAVLHNKFGAHCDHPQILGSQRFSVRLS